MQSGWVVCKTKCTFLSVEATLVRLSSLRSRNVHVSVLSSDLSCIMKISVLLYTAARDPLLVYQLN